MTAVARLRDAVAEQFEKQAVIHFIFWPVGTVTWFIPGYRLVGAICHSVWIVNAAIAYWANRGRW